MALLEFLQKHQEAARKVFGKRELRIMEKQLWGLTLSQSEKNRLSRDIRKKLEFIRKMQMYTDEFTLKHGDRVKKLTLDAKEAIIDHPLFHRIQKIVLFGSTVERRRHLGSDVDIAVSFKEITLHDATKFRIEVSGRLSDAIDVQVYNVLPEKVKKEIDEKGRVLYERKN